MRIVTFAFTNFVSFFNAFNRSLRPLDRTTIVNSVKKTSRLVTVEEGWPHCGIGELTSFHQLLIITLTTQFINFRL